MTQGPTEGPSGTLGRHASGTTYSHGWDFSNGVTGTDVWAAAPGTVITAATGFNNGWGNYVRVDHGDGTIARYAHLDHIHVSQGQAIGRGAVIGGEGNTGNST